MFFLQLVSASNTAVKAINFFIEFFYPLLAEIMLNPGFSYNDLAFNFIES
jgi:hypothetical protein